MFHKRRYTNSQKHMTISSPKLVSREVKTKSSITHNHQGGSNKKQTDKNGRYLGLGSMWSRWSYSAHNKHLGKLGSY